MQSTTTPPTKEHTMKRTIATLAAVVFAALTLSAVASAKNAPASFHGSKVAPAHKSVRHAPAVKLAHFGHHHLAV